MIPLDAERSLLRFGYYRPHEQVPSVSHACMKWMNEDLGRQLRVGTLWINDYNAAFPQAPWGGFKASGIGRELSTAGLEAFSEVKHVYLNCEPQEVGWFQK